MELQKEAVFAHSHPAGDPRPWEELATHQDAVGAQAAARAERFGFVTAARAAGQLHDMSKVSVEFQNYIRGQGSSVDHSTAGARTALSRYGPQLGKLLAFVTAGHHAGLADGVALAIRLDPAKTPVPAFTGWDTHSAPPSPAELAHLELTKLSGHKGFSHAFLIRMLFSCLVDADFVETERFYGEQPRGGFTAIPARL